MNGMKAVILAGGAGSRLRPLTCNIPKPMARVAGKPIIEYIFELLIKNGVESAGVTLGYLPHVIENAYSDGYKKLKLNFYREDEPLGTAGSVRKAAVGYTEPFFVVSGDALCNFELDKIMEYHKASGAKITIVGKTENDPREFGTVKVDKNNRVTGFIEKPSWSQAMSNLANTGVYVVDPDCLELIPEGKSFDFAGDLFPLMLEKDMPIYCYHTDSYWCDVGNIGAFLQVQRAALDGEIRLFTGETAEGIFAADKLPKGDYNIVPPVYIGRNTEISDGCIIGPYAVIDDNCFIGKGSKIRHSAVLENSYLSSNVSLTGALVCSGATLKNGVSMFEGSTAGSGCIIGENAAICPEVSIWPEKIVGRETKLLTNLKYGNTRSQYLGENGLDEKSGTRLDSLMCARLGAAIGSTHNGKRTGIATDSSKTAKMMSHAVSSGVIGAGGAVWDFGECFEAQLNFLVNYCDLTAGIFLKNDENREIRICGEGGLSIPRFFERSIESLILKGEFHETNEDEIKEISDLSGLRHIYNRELFRQAPYGLDGIYAGVKSENRLIDSLLKSTVAKLGASASESEIFVVDSSGTKVEAFVDGEVICHEKLLAICCLDELRNGRDIAVPYDAPPFLDDLAVSCGRKAYRYLSTPANNSDSHARRLAAKQVFVRDGLFLTVKLLSVMKDNGCTLSQLVSQLPEKAVLKKRIPIGFSPAELAGIIGEESAEGLEGIKLVRSNGKLLIIPEKSGDFVRVLAEADTMEAADELFVEIEHLIKNNNIYNT